MKYCGICGTGFKDKISKISVDRMSSGGRRENIVNLGCGRRKESGELGVDIRNTDEADIIQDLDQEEWDKLETSSFDHVKARDIYEHLENPVQFMEEVHRICRDGAKVEIRGPHLSSQNWIDPTHERLLGVESLSKYFSREGPYSYYSRANFRQVNVEIKFSKRKMFPWNYVLEPLVNLSFWTQFFYENTFLSRLFPASDIEFTLECIKPECGNPTLERKLEQMGVVNGDEKSENNL